MEEPVDGIAQNQSEGTGGPRLGMSSRPTFGMTRDQGRRVEITFALKQGGMLSAVDELDESLTADSIAEYGKQLTKDVAEGRPRMFADGWNASGQQTWVNLGEVVAFSIRPAK